MDSRPGRLRRRRYDHGRRGRPDHNDLVPAQRDRRGRPGHRSVTFGAPGWIPVTGDWNGDGTTTIGVVDPTTMTWYLRNATGAGAPDIAPFTFGAPGWIPVTGD